MIEPSARKRTIPRIYDSDVKHCPSSTLFFSISVARQILLIISNIFDFEVVEMFDSEDEDIDDDDDDDDDDGAAGFSIPSLIIADISFIKSNTFDLFIFNSSVNESSNSAPTSRISISISIIITDVRGDQDNQDDQDDQHTFRCSSKAFDFLKFDSALIRAEY